MPLDVLTGEAVRCCVPMAACIDLRASTMIAVSRGEATMPLRSFVDLGDAGNAFVVMPGAAARPPVFGAKLLSIFPRNATRPVIQGLIVVFDASDGRAVAVVDAGSVTALRTAAASGMATRALAREDAATLALLGTGVLLGLIGADRAFRPFVTVLGFAVSPLTLHQASFAVWAGATGLHVLARLVPALCTARPSNAGGATPHGRRLRTVALVGVTSLAAVASATLLSLASSWDTGALLAG
jgi:hypothetical protein